MQRCIMTALVLGMVAFFSHQAPAQEPDRNDYVEYYENFVGDWVVALPDGSTSDMSVRRTKSGAFLFESEMATYVHGWDPVEGCMRSMDMTADGAHGSALIKLDDNTIEGMTEGKAPDGTDIEMEWSITQTAEDRFVFESEGIEIVFERK